MIDHEIIISTRLLPFWETQILIIFSQVAKPDKRERLESSPNPMQASSSPSRRSFKGVAEKKDLKLTDMSQEFASFVRNNLDKQGLDLSEEEQRLIFEAIQKTLQQDNIVQTLQKSSSKSHKDKGGDHKKSRKHSTSKT